MFVNSPLNYTGNKFKQLNQLYNLLPPETSNLTLVDLFAGSCSVSTNFAFRFNNVICNDVIQDLISIHTELYNNATNESAIYDMLDQYSSDQPEEYASLRNAYNACINQKERSYRLYGLILSCTNNFMRFNKSMKFNQTCGKRKFNDNTKKKLHDWLSMLSQTKNISFISNDFSDVVLQSETFVYCDPPYSNTEAGYNTLWKQDDDIRLYEYIIKNQTNKFMISSSMLHGNKTSLLVEKLLTNSTFNLHKIEYNYKKVAKKEKETIEICLTNY